MMTSVIFVDGSAGDPILAHFKEDLYVQPA
jgi:hypothetical protein